MLCVAKELKMDLKYKIRLWIFDIRFKVGGFFARLGLRIVPMDWRFWSVNKVRGMTSLNCLEPHSIKGGPVGWATSVHCPYTGECNNHQCFFKQRDYYGLSSFLSNDPEEQNKQDELREQLIKTYGESFWPNVRLVPSTNCMHLICKDGK